MAFALIATVAEGSTDIGQSITTSAIDTSGANLITVCVSSFQTNPAPTLTDSKSNTWTGLTVQEQATAARIRIFYCFNPTVGSGHTFTATNSPTASFPVAIVHAWSGAASSPFDQENGASSAGIGPTSSGSVTPSEDNELILTAVSQGGASVTNQTSIDGGFTMSGNVSRLAANHQAGAAAYLIQTSAAAANPAWTHANSGATAVRIATFKAAAVSTTPKVGAVLAAPRPRLTAPIAVLTIAASLLTSTLAPTQPLPPLGGRTATTLPDPPPIQLRGFVDGGRLTTTLAPTAPPPGQRHDTLPSPRPSGRGFVDGGRLLTLLAPAPTPPGKSHDTLPLPRRAGRGFVDGGRVVYTPSEGPPPGRQVDALPPRVRGTWQITVSTVPVVAPPPPPVLWPLPGRERVTQHGSVQDAWIARTFAPQAPVGEQWDVLPRPRRLAPRDWLWSSARVVLAPPLPRGKASYDLPVVPRRDRRPMWTWGPPPSSLEPPPDTFDCLHIAISEAWPRVIPLALDSPTVVVAEAWPRVVDLDGC